MWRPPERIRFEPTHGRMPTREEAARALLFSSVSVGGVTLEQRTWIPAMVPWRATEDGFVTDDVIAWYQRFAQGRPGAIVVEATGIRDVPSGPLLRIGNNANIPGLQRLAQAIRDASDGHTRVFIQIIDFLNIRRRSEREKFFQRFLQITDRHRTILGMSNAEEATVRARLLAVNAEELASVLSPAEKQALDFGYREKVTDLHLPHIRELPVVLPDLFATAAARAEFAGFDGVELHYAHAYTMASFLSRTNMRDDGYGGTIQNRLRLPLEVFKRVRGNVSAKFVVGCRYLADECIPDGSDVDEAVQFGLAFAQAGMDFISTSRGGKFDDAKQPAIGWTAYPYTGRSGYECMPQYISDAKGPFGRNVAATAAIRATIRGAHLTTPIVCTGGIHNFKMAENILQIGACDIVGSARQSLADPDWFRKMQLGRGREVRLCEFTNYCEGLDQKHKPVTCKLWDKLELGPGVSTSPDGKRRMTAPSWTP